MEDKGKELKEKGLIDYKSTKKIIEQMEQCIYSINLGNNQFTGFVCKIPFPNENNQFPVLITQNSIKDFALLLQKNGKLQIYKMKDFNDKIKYQYQEDINIKDEKEMKLLNLKDRLIYLSKKYNTTIIEIKEEDNINNFIELDKNMLNDKVNDNIKYLNETIYIIQYIGNDLNISYGIINKIDDTKYYFNHNCSTKQGSLGSPIIRKNNKLIGIHIGNKGIFINYPINEFIKENYNMKGNKNIINSNIISSQEDFDEKKSFDINNKQIEILDLSNKNIKNSQLYDLSQKEFIKLKELYLNNNKITNISKLANIKIPKLEILNLSSNRISDINILEKFYFPELKKLDFYYNNISDIKVLMKVKFVKLEYLNLGGNNISDIKILEFVNLKELKYLNLFDNEISDIKVLEKVNFKKLEILNLGANRISDINILEKVNFKDLKILYLHINFISNIKVFDKVNLEKLEYLNLFENVINETENKEVISKLKSKIKYFKIEQDKNLFSNNMFIGMILDVSNDILSRLIKFNNTKSFLENFYSNFNGEIVTLINGQDEISYFDLNNLLLSTINYLGNENTISLINHNSYLNNSNQNLFNEKCLLEIFAQPENNDNSIEFINSKKIYENILNLKTILSKSYNQFLPNYFELFHKYISKPSSISLPLKKILELFEKDYIKNKYIIIISDGNTKPNSESIKNLIKEAKKNNITIVTYLLSQNTNIQKIIYNDFPVHLNQNIKNLFDISSKVNYKNPVARYYIKNNWNFPDNEEGTLFFETNLEESPNSNTNTLANDLNQIHFEGIDIKICDINYNNFIKFKYNFLAKHQALGTCWANAISAIIFLSNKRILGRKTKTFETYRENLIKLASFANEDGGDITIDKAIKFIEDENLFIKKRNLLEAKTAIEKGRFVYFVFRLNKKQWDHFNPNSQGVIDENELNIENINNTQNNNLNDISGHAILLIEITGNCYRFLNSWGSNWGENGTFKVNNPEILKPYGTNINPDYYDIVYYEEELPQEEKDFYNNNIYFIRHIINNFGEMSVERIRYKMNHLYQIQFICSSCRRSMTKDKFKKYIQDGLYMFKCSLCNYSQRAQGILKKLFILEDLMDDGNTDFDINFKEQYNFRINRAELHENIFLTNKSDLCSLGSENLLDNKIDPLFIGKANNVICMQDGIFVASGTNMILVFEIISRVINRKRKTNINYLITRNILNDDLWTLCDLQLRNLNLFASGGADLKIFQINYSKLDLNLRFRFNNNKNINKLIVIDDTNPNIIKKIIVCDQDGYIGIYNIKPYNNNNIKITVEFQFKKRIHNNRPINCILYLPDEQLLVSGSYEDKSLYFWEIQENDLRNVKQFSHIEYGSTIYNDSLLDINGKLLVGVEKGIIIYRHRNREITFFDYFENEEFGGVYSIKSLENNYFICGRSYGFCSLFLLRETAIRKINIFRNNNLSFNGNYNAQNDEYHITNICIKKINDSFGYILVSSIDKTLKVYCYNNLSRFSK